MEERRQNILVALFFHGYQTCDCKQLVLNEQNVALTMMFFSSWKEVVQEIEWCGAMRGVEDSWSNTFWVVYLR